MCAARVGALIVAVPSFGVAALPADEGDLADYADLEFAARLAGQVSQALASFGYSPRLVTDTELLTGGGIGSLVREVTGADAGVAAQIVHVVSHGEPSPTDGVVVVGSDGQLHPDSDVSGWLSRLEIDSAAPVTLFLLDLCFSGSAARLPWQLRRADGSLRGWVLAACEADRYAFDGRFSAAVARILKLAAAGGLGVDASREFLPLDLLAKRIRREVAARAVGGSRQLVTGTVVDFAVDLPELPFFRNPAYEPPTEDQLARATLPPDLAAFWGDEADLPDVGFDATHFAGRASGRRTRFTTSRMGLFRGRASQMVQLSEWLDEPCGSAGGAVLVVTGSPGAGKSAVLGVLVCAAHPALRASTRALWQHLDRVPQESQGLVAVHARQRSLADVVAAVGDQLGLTEPAGGWTAAELISALSRLDAVPTVVVDGLDEAVNPAALVSVLLLPLSNAVDGEGKPQCRLLVGTRSGPHWPQIAPLIEARGPGEIIDLDDVPAHVLERDLSRYLEAALADWALGVSGMLGSERVRSLVAEGVARILTVPAAEPAPDQYLEQPQWGPFLVAGLFAHHLLRRPLPNGRKEIAAVLREVPRSLPDVLELDVGAANYGDQAEGGGDTPWLREVLNVLAASKGDGLPLQLIHTLTMSVAGRQLPIEQVAAALARTQFYLRQSVDTDSTTLYRLFHQGLADHLRSASTVDDAHIVEGILADVSDRAGQRHWDLASPYVLRHLSSHAADAGQLDRVLTDPGFLVHGDPATMLAVLPSAPRTPAALLAAAVYRASIKMLIQCAPANRRDLLAIDAARYGDRDLSRRFAAVPNDHLPVLRPRWATGSQPLPALWAILAGHTSTVTAVACTVLDGRAVAVTGSEDATVRVWDLASGQQIGDALAGHIGTVRAVACTVLHGRAVAVTGSEDKTARVWDLASGQQIGDPLADHITTVGAVACTVLDGRAVAVTGNDHGKVRVWDLIGGQLIWDFPGHVGIVTAVACTVVNGQSVAVTSGGDGKVRVWDLANRQLARSPLQGYIGTVTAMTCTLLDRRPVAVTGSHDGVMRIWDLASGQQIGNLSTDDDHLRDVKAVACTVRNGRAIAITYSSGTVRVWDLATRQQIEDPLTGHIRGLTAMACVLLGGHPAAVTGSLDGTVRVWDLAGGQQIGTPLIGHLRDVTAVACTVLNGRAVAITGSRSRIGYRSHTRGRDVDGDDLLLVWDLASGQQISQLDVSRIGGVSAMACTTLGTGGVAVLVGGDHSMLLWDLARRKQVGSLSTGYNDDVTGVVCTVLDRRVVVVTAGRGGAVRLWDLARGGQIGDPMTGHEGPITAVACTTLKGRPVAVTGGDDGTVRNWDLTDRQPIGHPVTGHEGPITAVACTRLKRRPVAVTGGDDGTTRVWDLARGQQIGQPLTGHTGTVMAAVCMTLRGRPVAVTSGKDGTLRVWDIADRLPTAMIRLPAQASTLASSPQGLTVVGFGHEIVVFEDAAT